MHDRPLRSFPLAVAAASALTGSALAASAVGFASSAAFARPATQNVVGSVHASAAAWMAGIRVPAWLRVGPPPAHAAGHGWMSPDAKAGKVVYVADQASGAIKIYKQKGTNQSPIGQITSGLSGVDGLATDLQKNLYACNFGNGTVTVYAPGGTTPSKTLTGAGSPIDAVVAKDGTVYVSNFNSGTNGAVYGYQNGSTTPTETVVTFGAGSFPEGLAIDSKGNLYIAFNTNDGEVLKWTPGDPSTVNLGIHVGYVGGLTTDKNDNLLLVDQNVPGVDVFPPGAVNPSQQITGFHLAFDLALNKKNTELFVTTPFGSPPSVSRVSYPAGTIDDTITSGLSSAFGVATSPAGSP